jgi:hypothetical protein
MLWVPSGLFGHADSLSSGKKVPLSGLNTPLMLLTKYYNPNEKSRKNLTSQMDSK